MTDGKLLPFQSRWFKGIGLTTNSGQGWAREVCFAATMQFFQRPANMKWSGDFRTAKLARGRVCFCWLLLNRRPRIQEVYET